MNVIQSIWIAYNGSQIWVALNHICRKWKSCKYGKFVKNKHTRQSPAATTIIRFHLCCFCKCVNLHDNDPLTNDQKQVKCAIKWLHSLVHLICMHRNTGNIYCARHCPLTRFVRKKRFNFNHRENIWLSSSFGIDNVWLFM